MPWTRLMVIQLQPHLHFYWERITHLCMIQRVLSFIPPLLNVCGSSALVSFVPAKWENLPSGLHVPAEIGRQTDGYARFMSALKSSVTSQRLKKTWCWERLRAGGERGDRGWDGWMAPLTQQTWVWANSRSWWRIGKPGKLQSMGLQRAGHDWVIEQWQQQ